MHNIGGDEISGGLTWEFGGHKMQTRRVVIKANLVARVKLTPRLHERPELAGYEITLIRLVDNLGNELRGGTMEPLALFLALYQQPRLRVQMLPLRVVHHIIRDYSSRK
jgi:hypothetical protein